MQLSLTFIYLVETIFVYLIRNLSFLLSQDAFVINKK